MPCPAGTLSPQLEVGTTLSSNLCIQATGCLFLSHSCYQIPGDPWTPLDAQLSALFRVAAALSTYYVSHGLIYPPGIV